MLLIFDNTPPSRARSSIPTTAPRSTARSLLRGASSDNTSLIKVQVRIGKTRTSPTPTTASSTSWAASTTGSAAFTRRDDYENTSYATDNGDGTWTLPIYVRVYDYAGNVSTNEPSNPADPLYPDDLAATYGDALSFDPLKIPSTR